MSRCICISHAGVAHMFNSQLLEMFLDFHDKSSVDPVLKSLVADCTVDPIALKAQHGINGTEPAHTHADFNENYLTALLRMRDRTFDLKDATLPDEDGNHPVTDSGPSDYLDPVYEDEYLTNLDEQLVNEELFNDVNKPLEKPKSRVLPGDKDLANQNSDSVLSWLRRHHPETFIQEKDPAEAKAEKKPRGSNKKASVAQAPKPEKPEVVKVEPKAEPEPEAEEEGDAATGEAGDKWRGRKHKSTKDDEAYRPKGGSSRGSKRKREETESKTPGRGKRAKGQNAAAP
jgi:IEC3 subunit of the Ino80 complex, chromatin re-modelling